MAHATGQTDPISDAYAKALFTLALEKGALPDVAEELDALAKFLDANADLAALFAHPTLDRIERAASIQKLFKGRVHPITLNFLLLLNQKGRLSHVRTIRATFDRIAKEARGEVDVEVHTARPLNSAQLDAVAARLSKMIGKKALLHPHTDEKLIGGLRIRVGDKLIDASVSAQLRKLSRKLDSAGHDALRAAADKVLVA